MGSESNSGRPRILYVSYDGVGSPIGRSQILGYLELLARDHDIALVSFEQSRADARALRTRLTELGIDWTALRYHGRPPVLSTALDVARGRRAVGRAARRAPPDVVHVRSDVAALVALGARRATGGRLLFDIRGFWADERVEGGLWRAGGILHRVASRCERRFYAEADAVVTLTAASLPRIRAWTAPRSPPIEVIPTCVDPRRFASTAPRPGGPHAVWIGSIGTWYRFDLAARLAGALDLPLTVLTRQDALARRLLGGQDAEVRSVHPEAVPRALHAGDIGMCLIAGLSSKVASAPIRFAEYLAAGMPVAVTPGVGDLEAIVQEHRVGVVVRGEDDTALEDAARALRALAADPETAERCRRLAAERFDVAAGSARYAALYRTLSA